MKQTLPITAVIATRDRPKVLERTLDTLWAQNVALAECLIIDASQGDSTLDLCKKYGNSLTHVRATQPGAASQRNEGTALAQESHILYLDDDLIIEPGCLEGVWEALQESGEHGGACAMITNQKYHPPGKLSRLVFRWLNGAPRESYAGLCFGPGLAQLPSDDPSLPEVVPIEWMNAGFALYRREALPEPPFDAIFYGASTCEDLALSLKVAKKWKLVNARCAEIYHDSQPGEHKRSVVELAAMEIVNRHYVMRHVMEKKGLADYAKLALMVAFYFAGTLAAPAGRRDSMKRAWGNCLGGFRVIGSIMNPPTLISARNK